MKITQKALKVLLYIHEPCDDQGQLQSVIIVPWLFLGTSYISEIETARLKKSSLQQNK